MGSYKKIGLSHDMGLIDTPRNFTERLNIIRKYVMHKSKVLRPKVKVTIRSEVQLCLKLSCS